VYIRDPTKCVGFHALIFLFCKTVKVVTDYGKDI